MNSIILELAELESFQDKKVEIRTAVNLPDIIIALFLLKTIMITLCYTFLVIENLPFSKENSLNYRTMLELIMQYWGKKEDEYFPIIRVFFHGQRNKNY